MKKGFTLVEIIISIAIIVVIGTGATFFVINTKKHREVDILVANEDNFSNALEVYLSTNSYVVDNIYNNAEGAVISLEVLKNEGLISDDLEIDYENNYYVVSNAFLGNKNLGENVVEEECENSIGLEKIASWASSNDTTNVLYFCPKDDNYKPKLNDPKDSCVSEDNRMYCKIIKNAENVVNNGNNELTILGEDTREHNAYTEIRPQEYSVNITYKDFKSYVYFYKNYSLIGDTLNVEDTKSSSSITWSEFKNAFDNGDYNYFKPSIKGYGLYSGVSSSFPHVPTEKNEFLNKITGVSDGCKSSDCEIKYQIIDFYPSTVRSLLTSEDNYGLSYYFKGNVVDNYVNFAGMCWRIVRVQGDGSLKLILSSKNNTCQNDDKDSILSYVPYGGQRDAYGDHLPLKSDFELSGSYGNFSDLRKTSGINTTLKQELDNFFDLSLASYNNMMKKERVCTEYNFDNEDGSTTIDNTKLYCNTIGDKTTSYRYTSALMYSELLNARDNDNSYLDYMLSNFKNTYTAYIETCGANVAYANTAEFYTITPVDENNSYYVYTSRDKVPAVASDDLSHTPCYALAGVRPVIILKSDVVASGNGTKSNPYVIN